MSVVHPSSSDSKPHLRLVVGGEPSRQPTSQHTTGYPPRARDFAQLDPDTRQLRQSILAGAMAAGFAVNPDAVSAILATKAQHRGPIRYFTEDMVWDMIWFDISHWCGTRGLELPAGMHRALWFVLGYLDESGELHPHSDHLDDLRSPLFSSAGLDYDGEPRFRD